MQKITQADNLSYLRELPSDSIPLIYIDPPFNTGKTQKRTQISTVRDEGGDRTGFGGTRYTTTEVGTTSYEDKFEDYLGFLYPRLVEAYRVLSPSGSFFFHIDPRESHYCKVMLDGIFGRDNFQNEIIWAYDYGARTKKRWPSKHDVIFWYTKSAEFTFDLEACDRIAYMSPELVGPEKTALGKTPTDTWWHTIVPTNGKEKTGYATQKPLGLIERIVKVHSKPGDVCLDFFAGSGTLGEAAAKNGRGFLLVDSNPQAIEVMNKRLKEYL